MDPKHASLNFCFLMQSDTVEFLSINFFKVNLNKVGSYFTRYFYTSIALHCIFAFVLLQCNIKDDQLRLV